MIDPYQPELGRVGLTGLVQRVVENAGSYMSAHVPIGLTGLRAGALVGLLGIVLFGLAGWGWARRFRRRPGVAEVFVPMYLGLILLWPQVWSGDRFALPLLPLLLFYAGEVILHLAERVPAPARKLVVGASVAVLAFPALASWSREVRVGSGCSALVRSEGAFVCWGARNTQFVQAALWSGAHLPEGSVVLSRKPRIFYVMSGVASQTFPFTKDGTRFLAVADSLGARYVVMDYLDAAASVYVAGRCRREGRHVLRSGRVRTTGPGTHSAARDSATGASPYGGSGGRSRWHGYSGHGPVPRRHGPSRTPARTLGSFRGDSTPGGVPVVA